jgi:tyrosine-protein phosphatase SIW14
MNNKIKKISTILIALGTIALFTAAQTSPRTDFPNIKIDNFGQMNEHYYRGAQPNPDDYASLAALGVKTVVDLRDDPTDYEKSGAEAAGMKYVNIPMSGWQSPRDEDINAFLKLANDPASGTIFVHCKAGIHRTGIVAAIYRFTSDGWDYDKAYTEMTNYNCSAGLFHGALKTYVKQYSDKLKAKKGLSASAAAQVQASN